jgi:hypothetical protein
LAPAGFELSAIVAPPLGAADVKATVQVVVAGGVSDTALHENPFRANWVIVTVPPVVDNDSDEPVPSEAPLLFVNCSGEEVFFVVLDTVRETVATIPLAIGVEFSPMSTQVVEPAPLLQKRDLFVSEPTANVADEKSTVE